MLNLTGANSLYTDRELMDRAAELELSADETIVVAQLMHLDVDYVRGYIRAAQMKAVEKHKAILSGADC